MSDEGQSDRRRFPRVNAPVYYRSASIFGPRQRLLDIGLGGMRIYTDDPLKVGKRLEIELFLADSVSVEAQVRVVWVRELTDEADARYDVGLEFLSIKPEDAERLKAAVG